VCSQKDGWTKNLCSLGLRVWKPLVAQFRTAVKEAFNELKMEIDFIPKGYTCKLQPMDVGINTRFKNYTYNQFNKDKNRNEFMAHGGFGKHGQLLVELLQEACGEDVESRSMMQQLEQQFRLTVMFLNQMNMTVF
jgi:hypothetical protein